MLTITIPANEQWDEQNQEFVYVTKKTTLHLEHSLVSLSKWESKWCKPFIDTKEKTYEETIDYIRCMTLDKNVDPNVYKCLTNQNMEDINNYISAPMTATWFNDRGAGPPNREIITSELIYYSMVAYNIPFECQKWHLNRLLTLIRICNIKEAPPKKIPKREIMSRNAALNAARRKKLSTKG